jgi:hypothetical protein
VTALGGLGIVTMDDDINLAYQNPSLLNPEMNHRLSVSNSIYVAGINHGYAAYARYHKKWNATLGGGILYRTYGSFDATDQFGQSTGTFSGSEYVVNAGGAYQSNKMSYGTNVKFLYSHLESYSSVGMAMDVAATFNDTASRITAAVVFKNMGVQFKPYTPKNREKIPFEIQVGFSKRLKYLPFRLSVLLHNLQQANIRYDDPSIISSDDVIFQDSTSFKEKKFIGDKIFRHVIVSGEFYFGKSLRARFAYNHLRRKEMSVETARGLVGFSLGAGIRIKQFYIDYSHAFMHQAGGSNHLTIATSLSHFLKK